ncbi:hypothetical protein RCL1_006841 [Eukaryota sp. TZLM3-RCL]
MDITNTSITSDVSEYFAQSSAPVGYLFTPPSPERRSLPGLSRSLLSPPTQTPTSPLFPDLSSVLDVSSIVVSYQKALNFYTNLLKSKYFSTWSSQHQQLSRLSFVDLTKAYSLYRIILQRRVLALFSYNRKRRILRRLQARKCQYSLISNSFFIWKSVFVSHSLYKLRTLKKVFSIWYGINCSFMEKRLIEKREIQAIQSINFYAELIKKRYLNIWSRKLTFIVRQQSALQWYHTKISSKYLVFLFSFKEAQLKKKEMIENAYLLECKRICGLPFKKWLKISRLIKFLKKVNDILDYDFERRYYELFNFNMFLQRDLLLLFFNFAAKKYRQSQGQHFSDWLSSTNLIVLLRAKEYRYLTVRKQSNCRSLFNFWSNQSRLKVEFNRNLSVLIAKRDQSFLFEIFNDWRNSYKVIKFDRILTTYQNSNFQKLAQIFWFSFSRLFRLFKTAQKFENYWSKSRVLSKIRYNYLVLNSNSHKQLVLSSHYSRKKLTNYFKNWNISAKFSSASKLLSNVDEMLLLKFVTKYWETEVKNRVENRENLEHIFKKRQQQSVLRKFPIISQNLNSKFQFADTTRRTFLLKSSLSTWNFRLNSFYEFNSILDDLMVKFNALQLKFLFKFWLNQLLVIKFRRNFQTKVLRNYFNILKIVHLQRISDLKFRSKILAEKQHYFSLWVINKTNSEICNHYFTLKKIQKQRVLFNNWREIFTRNFHEIQRKELINQVIANQERKNISIYFKVLKQNLSRCRGYKFMLENFTLTQSKNLQLNLFLSWFKLSQAALLTKLLVERNLSLKYFTIWEKSQKVIDLSRHVESKVVNLVSKSLVVDYFDYWKDINQNRAHDVATAINHFNRVEQSKFCNIFKQWWISTMSTRQTRSAEIFCSKFSNEKYFKFWLQNTIFLKRLRENSQLFVSNFEQNFVHSYFSTWRTELLTLNLKNLNIVRQNFVLWKEIFRDHRQNRASIILTKFSNEILTREIFNFWVSRWFFVSHVNARVLNIRVQIFNFMKFSTLLSRLLLEFWFKNSETLQSNCFNSWIFKVKYAKCTRAVSLTAKKSCFDELKKLRIKISQQNLVASNFCSQCSNSVFLSNWRNSYFESKLSKFSQISNQNLQSKYFFEYLKIHNEILRKKQLRDTLTTIADRFYSLSILKNHLIYWKYLTKKLRKNRKKYCLRRWMSAVKFKKDNRVFLAKSLINMQRKQSNDALKILFKNWVKAFNTQQTGLIVSKKHKIISLQNVLHQWNSILLDEKRVVLATEYYQRRMVSHLIFKWRVFVQQSKRSQIKEKRPLRAWTPSVLRDASLTPEVNSKGRPRGKGLSLSEIF